MGEGDGQAFRSRARKRRDPSVFGLEARRMGKLDIKRFIDPVLRLPKRVSARMTQR